MTHILKRTLSPTGEIFSLSDVLSPDECTSLTNTTEAQGFQAAPITVGPGKFRMAPEIRNNKRVMFDQPDLAGTLWQRIAEHMPTRVGNQRALGLNERFRVYRYERGEQFNWHRDGAFHRSPSERSLFSLLFYLNDDFSGGTTDFSGVEEGIMQVRPQRGSALAFIHPLLHRGAPVIQGCKYVLRTDVMYEQIT
jgi:prolyl 4-hydroxylase